jgi:hypothetical protein
MEVRLEHHAVVERLVIGTCGAWAERPSGLLIWMPRKRREIVTGSPSGEALPKFGAKLNERVSSCIVRRSRPRTCRHGNALARRRMPIGATEAAADLLIEVAQVRRLGVRMAPPTSADNVFEPKKPGLVVRPALASGT